MPDMPDCLLQERIFLINCLQDTGPAVPQHPLEPGEMYFYLKSQYGREEGENLDRAFLCSSCPLLMRGV